MVPRYVGGFCASGMNLELAEAAWNRHKTEGIELKKIPSIDRQRTFVQGTSRRELDIANVEETGVDENWDFEWTVSSHVVAESGIREEPKDIQQLRK